MYLDSSKAQRDSTFIGNVHSFGPNSGNFCGPELSEQSPFVEFGKESGVVGVSENLSNQNASCESEAHFQFLSKLNSFIRAQFVFCWNIMCKKMTTIRACIHLLQIFVFKFMMFVKGEIKNVIKSMAVNCARSKG